MTPPLPDAAWTAPPARPPGMGPAPLGAPLGRCPPERAGGEGAAGRPPLDPVVAVPARVPDLGASRWRTAASTTDVGSVWEAHRAAGVAVLVPGDPRFPPVLALDPEPPRLLFCRGDVGALERPRVAVVGTRRCTWTGRAAAARAGGGAAPPRGGGAAGAGPRLR